MAYEIVTKNTVRDRFKSPPRPAIWTDTPEKDWNNWVWQQQKRIKSFDVLEKVINVTQEEREAFAKSHEQFNMGITPYYASLMDKDDPNCPIRLQSVPKMGELFVSPVDLEDPLGEEKDMPVPGITHRYPDRVLLKPAHACPVYCRFCFRREKVGPGAEALNDAELEAALGYIRARPEIWEVVLTGGDPLMMAPRRLAALIEGLDAITHVAVVRVHSRVPVVEPSRITDELVQALRRRRARACARSRSRRPGRRTARRRGPPRTERPDRAAASRC